MNAYEHLMNEWQVEAAGEGSGLNNYFAPKACEILNGHGYELPSFQHSYYREETVAGNVYPCVDGYCYDPNNRGALTMVICDFTESPTLLNMKQDELNKHFNHIKTFYNKAKKNHYQGISPGAAVSPMLNVLTDPNKGFAETNGAITFMLITNKRIPNTLRIPEDEVWKETGCSIKYEVADFEVISSVKQPPIELDFTRIVDGKYSQGIPYLSVNAGGNVDFYKSYLLVLPAEALVACYDQYTTRLLEHNVRVYLQRKGKVNKGIQKTITEEPQAFFIYNNGLAITADSVDFSEDGSRIMRLHNPQVVNGGQTMASLHDAKKRDKRDISGISVQVKLTVIPKLVTNVIVPYISRYSNSQNAVRESDKRSNEIAQRAYENYSRTIRIPGQRAVYWYYERLRGQYDNAQLHMTPGKKKAFSATYPKKLKVTPEEMAQAIMTYEMQPYLVVRGAQKVYNGDGSLKGFCDYIAIACDFNPSIVLSIDWYKKSIAKRILFVRTKEVVRQFIKDNVRFSGFKIYSSMAYVYVLSLLISILEEYGQSINLDKVWEYQDIDDMTVDNIACLCRFIFPIMAKDPAFAQNFKKKSTWDEIRQEALDSTSLVRDIKTKSSFYCDEKPFLITGIPVSTDPPSVEEQTVWGCPDSYWNALDTWLNYHRDIVKLAVLEKRLNHGKLTKKQCKKLLDLAHKCERFGGPVLPPPPVIVDETDKRVKSCEGNPVETFFSSNDYNILVLDRTCDLRGGSLFLDDLFRKFSQLKVSERVRACERKPELGEIRVFDVDSQKKIVFAYTRLTVQSIPYLPVLEVCLSAVAREFMHDHKVLMSHVWYEGPAPSNTLNRNRIAGVVKSELYMMESVTLMSQPISKD